MRAAEAPGHFHHIISRALAGPPQSIAYELTRAFRAWARHAAVLTTTEQSFDVQAYAAALHCSLRVVDAPTPRHDAAWVGQPRRTKTALRDGYFSIEWDGETIDAVCVTEARAWGPPIVHTVIGGESDELLQRFFAAVCTHATAVGDAIMVFANGCWNRSPELFHQIRAASFDDLVLEPTLAKGLRGDFAEFFASKEEYGRYGVPWKRGALFVGPPGNGKTHAIKALVNDLGVPCVYVQSFAGEHGVSDQRNIGDVFAHAREIAPCVMVLEDLDSLVVPEARSFFLNELDGFARNVGIVTIGSTNHAERLDPAIVDRPSRFDRKYHFLLPALPERERYVAYWSQRLVREAKLDDATTKKIAAASDGYSFAYLKELFVASLMRFREGAKEGRSFGEIVLEQAALLRGQMSSADLVPAVRANHVPEPDLR